MVTVAAPELFNKIFLMVHNAVVVAVPDGADPK